MFRILFIVSLFVSSPNSQAKELTLNISGKGVTACNRSNAKSKAVTKCKASTSNNYVYSSHSITRFNNEFKRHITKGRSCTYSATVLCRYRYYNPNETTVYNNCRKPIWIASGRIKDNRIQSRGFTKINGNSNEKIYGTHLLVSYDTGNGGLTHAGRQCSHCSTKIFCKKPQRKFDYDMPNTRDFYDVCIGRGGITARFDKVEGSSTYRVNDCSNINQ